MSKISTVLVLCGVLAYAATANATTIAQHIGNADPATEGWTSDGISNIAVGSGSDSHAYWLTPSKPAYNQSGRYHRFPDRLRRPLKATRMAGPLTSRSRRYTLA